MEATGIDYEPWHARLREVTQLYQEDRVEESVAAATALLHSPGIPQYHRIKANIIIAKCHPDSWEARKHCDEATRRCRIVRSVFPVGENATVDAQLAHLYKQLEGVEEEILDEIGKEYAKMKEEEEEEEEEEPRENDLAVGEGPRETPVGEGTVNGGKVVLAIRGRVKNDSVNGVEGVAEMGHSKKANADTDGRTD